MQQQIIQTTIDSMSHDGRGIASIQGKKTFLHNALQGETVNFIYTKKHSKYDEGKVVEILKPAPERVAPKCPHFAICGGCSMQHLEHPAQLKFKQQTLLEHLLHFGEIVPKEILPPITDKIWHYRSKARLGVKYVQKKNKVLVGFHEKNGRFIADIEQCPILHASIADKLAILGDLIAHLSIYQHIPQIEVAAGFSKTALVLRHLQPLSDKDLQLLMTFAKENNLHFFLQPKGINSIHCITDKLATTYLSYKLPQQQLELTFNITGFTQINQGINQKMINKVLELLEIDTNDTILDLFCGIGNFTLPIAKNCKNIIGIEGDTGAVMCAKENAVRNDIKNATFFAYDLNNELQNISILQQKFNKILLDPPRSGAACAIQQLAQFAAEKIVYVSCNPATLARDAKELSYQGYCLTKAGLIDMFPHTSHMEAIAVFEKTTTP